jgi:GxxExxY protein
VVKGAIEVHRALGPGLLESVYETCLAEEFAHQGVRFARQVLVPIVYRSKRLDYELRVDFVIEDTLLLELKSLEHVLPVHKSQVITYVNLLDLPQGLLINFNVSKLVDGVTSILGRQRGSST